MLLRVVLFSLLFLLVSPVAHAEKRVALVIGNSSYRYAGELPNPKNDATDMAAMLERHGFAVILGLDLNKAALDQKVRNFEMALRGADVGLFFYAGHGLQVEGQNYIVPTDAQLATRAALDLEMMRLEVVQRIMESEDRTNILFLDACRDNPLARNLAQAMGTRSTAIGRGLAPVQSGHGTLISFSTQPGNVAQDGTGRNSPFTGALLRHLSSSNEEIMAILVDVRIDVLRETRRQQTPWEHTALTGRFYFKTAAVSQASTPTPRDAGRPQIQSAPRASRLTKSDIVRLLIPFDVVRGRVLSDSVDKPDETKLLSAAVDAMQRAFPSASRISIAGTRSGPASNTASSVSSVKMNLNTLHDVAIQILNDQKSDADVRLIAAAIDGMLASLEPSSDYWDAKASPDMETLVAIGTELTRREGGLVKVVAPIDETPAAKAGIMANDIITHLDEEPVQGLTFSQVIEKMRGPVNTKIKLTVMRKGQDQPVEVLITREGLRVRSSSVRSRLQGDDVGYIRIPQFNAQTTEGLKKAITDLSAQAGGKLKGFVLDLRNNPGGLFDQAWSVLDVFLEKGEMFSIRTRNAEETQRFLARAGDFTNGKPIIVLINGGSASVSEIVAAALQDHRRATILGTRSFGNGSMQAIIPLGSSNGALRLTTARYFTPAGRQIQTTGISPDIEVLQEGPEEYSYVPPDAIIPPGAKGDNVLNTALDLIRGIQKNSAYPPDRRTAVPN